MKKNTGNFDRVVRLVPGVAMIAQAWFYLPTLGTVASVILAIVGVIVLGTSLLGSCPIYSVFGISTRKLK